MQIKSNLPVLMAKAGIKSKSELHRLTGWSYWKIRTLTGEKNQWVDKDFLVEVCDYFNCEIGELLELEKGGQA